MKPLTAETRMSGLTNQFDVDLTPIEQELPDARDLFEVRVRGTKTLILIPKNSMAQALLWDLMETPRTTYSLRGCGFKDDHTLRVREAEITFEKSPKPVADLPSKPKKVRTARRRRAS